MSMGKVEIKDDVVFVSVNPRLYCLEIVYSACYVFLDKAFVVLDGDPEKGIIVQIKPKQKEDLPKMGKEFLNELIILGFHYYQNKETMTLRSLILRRILMISDKDMPIYVDKDIEKQATDDVDLVYKDRKK